MSAVEILEWEFSPADYFEESYEVVRDDYTLSVNLGKAEARVPAELYGSDPEIRQKIHASLNDRFLGVQLLTFRPYTLSSPRRIRLHEDGRRDVIIEVQGVSAIAMGGTLDLRITAADGTVVADTKADRIAEKRLLAERIEKYRPTSSTLASMLASFGAATRDPQNELVHLYEVRDAVSSLFGGKSPAMKALGISAGSWSRLGQLCNDEPLRQGRHRGKNGVSLRDATHAELEEARELARSMLRAYVDFLANSDRSAG